MARKRAREKMKVQLRLKRVRAEVKILGSLNAPPVTEVRLFLNDISADGLGLFSGAPMMVGDEIALTMEEPKRFYVRGRIIACVEQNANSKVVSQSAPSYRVTIQFTFDGSAEREQVKLFCEDIAKNHLFGPGRQAA
jgi:hypothetical protein